MIQNLNHTIASWEIEITDRLLSGRMQTNPNKLNFDRSSNQCRINGCSNLFMRTRMSGLCDNHTNHQHDLFLTLKDPNGVILTPPAHKDIIDALIEWSTSRNYNLLPFFSSISFNTLGNIPDVTTLSGDSSFHGVHIPSLGVLFDSLIKVANVFFHIDNNSSYQPLQTPRGDIPAIVLVYTLIGLLICEEANRGDRWFCRIILNDETRTKQLGAAMPIAYFAARTFPWGVQMNKSARNLTL